MKRPLTSSLISVVVPFYNEGGFVASVLERIAHVLEGIGCGYEIVAIDDGSGDDTWSQVVGFVRQQPKLRALRLSRNFGKEAAICAGLDAARGDAVIVMDGDLQHPPDLMAEMVRLWAEGEADVVDGIKENRGAESWAHRASATLFYRTMKTLTGSDFDKATDYKLMDRKAVEAWKTLGERNLFFRGMSAWVGFRRVPVGFSVGDRIGGVSKWSLPGLTRLAANAVTAYSTAALHLITVLGCFVLLLAIVLGGQTLYNYFSGQAVSGFATVILLQLVIASVLMISLGIIGEYLARIYVEVKERPRYVVADSVGVSQLRDPLEVSRRGP